MPSIRSDSLGQVATGDSPRAARAKGHLGPSLRTNSRALCSLSPEAVN
jgi:hypothetical protein